MDAQGNVLKSKFTPYAPNHEHAYLNPLYPQNIELEFYKKTEVEALLRSKKDYKKFLLETCKNYFIDNYSILVNRYMPNFKYVQ